MFWLHFSNSNFPKMLIVRLTIETMTISLIKVTLFLHHANANVNIMLV